MAQLSYDFNTQPGLPGGLYDLSTHTIDSRIFEAMEGLKLRFGMGVFLGTIAGSNVNLPDEDSELSEFEGIVVSGHTQQQDLEGKTFIADGTTVGVLRAGRIWARLVDETEVSYGDPVYLVISGDDAGLFTNAEGENNLEIPARFISSSYQGAIAPVELTANRT